jgi:hypothetical protein
MTTSYGENPNRFPALNTLSPPRTDLRRKPGPTDAYEHLSHVDHSKGDSRPARRTRSVKAKPVARFGTFSKDSARFFQSWGTLQFRHRPRRHSTRAGRDIHVAVEKSAAAAATTVVAHVNGDNSIERRLTGGTELSSRDEVTVKIQTRPG